MWLTQGHRGRGVILDSLQDKERPQLPALLLRDRFFLMSLVLWGLNDHFFKYSYPSILTGKLSDVTSLICSPILLFIVFFRVQMAVTHLTRRGPRDLGKRYLKGLMTFCALSMSAIMIGINLSDTWADAYRFGLSIAQWPFVTLHSFVNYGVIPPLTTIKLTMDPSDIWTAPSSLLAILILDRAQARLNAQII